MSDSISTAIVAVEKSISGVQRQVSELDLKGREELSAEEFDAITLTTREVKLIKKQADDIEKALVKKVKPIFFKMADNAVGEDKPYTQYSGDNGLKMNRIIAQVQQEGVSGSELLAALYDIFGEPVGSTDGKAWKLWCKVSTPRTDRVFNEGMFTAEMEKAIEHELEGKKHGSTTLYIPMEAISRAKVAAKTELRFTVTEMTKSEKEDFEAGTLN